METIDICVTARYKDKEVAIVDLLKALFKDNEEYKDRIDKAVEYIEYNACCLHDEEILKDLLNILKGDNK